MKKTVIWIIVVVVIIIGAVLLSGKKGTPKDVTPTNTTTGENATTLKPATGNIDDAINSISSEASADAAAPSDTNTSLTTPSDLSGLDQALDTSKVQ